MSDCGKNVILDNQELTLDEAVKYMAMRPTTFFVWRKRWRVKPLVGGRFPVEQLLAARKREAAELGGDRESRL